MGLSSRELPPGGGRAASQPSANLIGGLREVGTIRLVTPDELVVVVEEVASPAIWDGPLLLLLQLGQVSSENEVQPPMRMSTSSCFAGKYSS